MRSLHMARYHWRRRWPVALLFALIMLGISTATLFYVRSKYAANLLVFEDGFARVMRGYGSLNLNFDYTGLFTVLHWAIAVVILRQERNFFITASASRWEVLLGLVEFAAFYALVLTGGSWLVGTLNRLSLMLMGMRVRSEWSLGLILTGNDLRLFRTLITTFTGMMLASGVWCLVYAVFARWWKQILILAAVALVVLIVLGVQITLGAYAQNLVETAQKLAQWLEEVFIPTVGPWLEGILAEDRLWVLVLRDLGISAACYCLVYPVILRMRIGK